MSGPIEVTQGTTPWETTPNTDPLPVTGPATNAQLRASPLPVAASLAAAVDVSDRAPRLLGIVALDAATLAALETIQIGSLPAVALDAATLAALETIQVGSLPAVALDAPTLAALESISVQNFPATQPVTGPLTDAQLRASTVPVTGPLTDAQLRASTVPVSGTVTASGPLTDTQLRALAVAVSGPATDAQLRATPLPVSGTVAATGPLTDAQLRAAVVPISDGGGSLTVDGTVGATQGTTPWKAREDTAAMTWVSVKSAAPAIGAVQADTGALAAGDYDFDVYLVVSDTVAVGKGLVIEHRNAANGATLQTLGGVSTQGELALRFRRYTMAANERLRIIAGTAAGAASSMYVSAIGRRVS
jgi:hypothetical protein